MPKKKKAPQLQNIFIIGQFDDGKFRQVLVSDNTKTIITSIIAQVEEVVKVYDKELSLAITEA